MGYGGSRESLRGWVALHDQGESGGGAGWTGEGLLATNGVGEWRRPNLPKMGKKASRCRSLAVGAFEEWLEVA